MPNQIVLDPQIQLADDPQPMLEQQIVVLMNAAGLRVLNRDDARLRLIAFDPLENQIEGFAGQQLDRLAEEPACCNFAIGSSFTLKGDRGRVRSGMFVDDGAGLQGDCPKSIALDSATLIECSIAAHV